MDVTFNCPKCEQELEVDSSGAGTAIECPTCGESIIIPEPTPATLVSGGQSPEGLHAVPHPINAIASSAAAKVEMHLKVPVHTAPTESLIQKAKPPLEVTAKETDKRLRVKTIRHTDCIEVGHDRFDEHVSNFLQKVGEQNVVSINTLTYTHIDIGSQKLLTDFAVMVVYRG